jgi:hypothetical protein
MDFRLNVDNRNTLDETEESTHQWDNATMDSPKDVHGSRHWFRFVGASVGRWDALRLSHESSYRLQTQVLDWEIRGHSIHQPKELCPALIPLLSSSFSFASKNSFFWKKIYFVADVIIHA